MRTQIDDGLLRASKRLNALAEQEIVTQSLQRAFLHPIAFHRSAARIDHLLYAYRVLMDEAEGLR